MSNIINLMMYMIYKRIKKLREDKDLTKQNIADMLHIIRSALFSL